MRWESWDCNSFESYVEQCATGSASAKRATTSQHWQSQWHSTFQQKATFSTVAFKPPDNTVYTTCGRRRQPWPSRSTLNGSHDATQIKVGRRNIPSPAPPSRRDGGGRAARVAAGAARGPRTRRLVKARRLTINGNLCMDASRRLRLTDVVKIASHSLTPAARGRGRPSPLSSTNTSSWSRNPPA